MTSVPPDAAVAMIAAIVFMIIVFWRIAIPLIVAVMLAKVVMALAAVAPAPTPAAATAALGLAWVSGTPLA